MLQCPLVHYRSLSKNALMLSLTGESSNWTYCLLFFQVLLFYTCRFYSFPRKYPKMRHRTHSLATHCLSPKFHVLLSFWVLVLQATTINMHPHFVIATFSCFSIELLLTLTSSLVRVANLSMRNIRDHYNDVGTRLMPPSYSKPLSLDAFK